MITLRKECAGDLDAITQVIQRAFGRPEEARLVNALRGNGAAVVSLVAVEEGVCVGHVLFSPVVLEAETGRMEGAGLAPLAVLPSRQRQGIGQALVRAGLETCRELGYGYVIVLGHPEYYPRFGFVPAARFGIQCEYDAPEEAFMAMELHPGVLDGHSGLVRYRPEFAQL